MSTRLLVILLLLFSTSSWAKLKIFAAEPEWAALAQELGGDRIDAFSATTAQQDPHHVQARPSLIARIRNADLLIYSGAELEIGWLPLLLRDAGNANIQPGQPGHLEAIRYVQVLEVPSNVSRADGDVHPAGNPHLQMDPRNIALVGEELSRRLIQLDGANAAYYRQRHDDFMRRWQEALTRWQARAVKLKGVPVVVHHKAWVYLLNWTGMIEVAQLEPKPGIPPSIAHLQELVTTLQRTPARMIIRAPHDDPQASQWLAERMHLPAVMLPGTVGGSDKAKDLFGLFDDTLDRLLGAIS